MSFLMLLALIVIVAVVLSRRSTEMEFLIKRIESVERGLEELRRRGNIHREEAAPPTPIVPPQAAPVPILPEKMPLTTPKTRLPFDELDKEPSLWEEISRKTDGLNWEVFTGVKLFAWIGGVALCLAAAFFLKYSIDQGWISPLVRVCFGFAVGISALAGGLKLSRDKYAVTVHVLCAAGIAILYTSVFAAGGYYKFLPTMAAFALMSLVTAAAFLLSARLKSKYVALLGLAGGFLTPILLNTGQDNLLGLFGYVAFLDMGLAALAVTQGWGFLTALSAAGTLMLQIGWVNRFFTVEKAPLASGIFLFFPALYAGFFRFAQRKKEADTVLIQTAAGFPMISLWMGAYMMGFAALGAKPGLLLTFIFLLSVFPAAMAFFSDKAAACHEITALADFALLLYWTARYLTPALLPWGLVFYLLFAGLNTFYPLLLKNVRPERKISPALPLIPLLMLFPILMSVLRETTASFLAWPFVFLIDGLVLALAFLLSAAWVGIGALVFTFLIGIFWLSRLPAPAGLGILLVIMGLFTLAFFAVGLYAVKKWKAHESADHPSLGQLPALSASLPFALLAVAAVQWRMENPSEVFGLAVLLVVLLLALVRYRRLDFMAFVGLGSCFVLSCLWHGRGFSPLHPWIPLGWYGGFLLLFYSFPYIYHALFKGRWIPWAASALAGPMFFWLIHLGLKASVPFYGECAGALPALFSLPYLGGLLFLNRRIGPENTQRNTLLALTGGVFLFFVSLIFPLQFDKEWLTVGWALEGLALVWYFRRVPHPGLKAWGGVLLLIAFIRLAVNPAVLSYHPRTPIPFANWYLYAYGITALAFFAAARLWRPEEEKIQDFPVPALGQALGTILAFLLMNIEIADFFSSGTALTFQFSGSLAQDMAYTLGWGLFALILLLAGFSRRSSPARWSGLGLLFVSVLKLFFHDLWRLGGLYRVASFVGLAAVLILVSFLYQKFLLKKEKLS